MSSLKNNLPTVYVIQEVAGTKAGNPKINIMGVIMVTLNFYFSFRK